jgi:hypothetical protein
MSTDPKALAVFLDAAREAFGELALDVAAWVEYPDAVRMLLSRARYVETHGDFEAYCCDCGEVPGDAHSRTQFLDSPGKP